MATRAGGRGQALASPLQAPPLPPPPRPHHAHPAHHDRQPHTRHTGDDVTTHMYVCVYKLMHVFRIKLLPYPRHRQLLPHKILCPRVAVGHHTRHRQLVVPPDIPRPRVAVRHHSRTGVTDRYSPAIVTIISIISSLGCNPHTPVLYCTVCGRLFLNKPFTFPLIIVQ